MMLFVHREATDIQGQVTFRPNGTTGNPVSYTYLAIHGAFVYS